MKLSQVADGLWTVEGAYSTSTDPADYFKPSRLYANVLASEESPRPVIRRVGKLHSFRALGLVKKRARRSPLARPAR